MSQEAPSLVGNSYDVVPYIDHAYSFAHPRYMEAQATLFGVEPAPITKCRVLELGCAAGGNLVPAATELPESTFLGIDSSPRQIAGGQQDIAALGLSNVQLRCANILDVNEAWGQFDYMICHGVFSWVPHEIQEKILEISQQNLAPQGVALISYNTFPGWHFGAAVRDLMRYHAAQFPDPQKQIEQAKAILKFLAELGSGDPLWGQLLKQELDRLRRVNNDNYMFHEHLEAHNHPLYLHEFVQRAESHGLQYLADTDFASMLLCHMPEQAREMFAGLPQVKLEQYLDFVAGRRFRRSLLCHDRVPLNRQLRGDRLMRFSFSPTGPIEASGVDIRNEEPATFVRGKGRLQTVNRLVKAAIMALRESYPRYVPFMQLYLTALRRVQQSRVIDSSDPRYRSEQLAEALLSCYSVNLVELCVHPPAVVSEPGPCPRTTPLVRLQAQQGKSVTSLRHHPVGLSALARRLVLRLDGSHDHKDLIECVRQSAAAGEANFTRQGETVRDPDEKALQGALDRTLAELCSVSLLTQQRCGPSG